MTLELLIQLLPLIENGVTVIADVIKELQASGHDPKAPLPPEHQAKIESALAPVAQPLFDATDPAKEFIDGTLGR